MASLFADLRSGFRMPDVQMNKGPLPNTAGGPAGSDGTADGRYNFNTALLSGITPYAYGEAARMGSDRNYQQIPHRIQKIIPPLYLPQRDGKAGQPKLAMTHAVDQGDVAFAVNLGADNQHLLLSPEDTFITKNDNVLASFTPFCNLATVNYLLAGLWRYGDCPGTRWMELSKAFNCGSLCGYNWDDVESFTKKHKQKPVKPHEKIKHVENIHCLLRTCIMPFGICAGSEHQGGMHELSLAPVTAAVNYVTVMTIDGQNRDLVNFWRANTLSAGDELIYRLDYRRTKQYTLNHFYKNVTHASFDDGEHFTVDGETVKMICPQLVPDVRTPFMNVPKDIKDKDNIKYSELKNMTDFFSRPGVGGPGSVVSGGTGGGSSPGSAVAGLQYAQFKFDTRFPAKMRARIDRKKIALGVSDEDWRKIYDDFKKKHASLVNDKLKKAQHYKADNITPEDEDLIQWSDSDDSDYDEDLELVTSIPAAVQKLNYRWAGYWRVGQLMHHRGAHVKNGMEYNCDTDFLTGGLLQVTFAPVWRECKPKHSAVVSVYTTPTTPVMAPTHDEPRHATMKMVPEPPQDQDGYANIGIHLCVRLDEKDKKKQKNHHFYTASQEINCNEYTAASEGDSGHWRLHVTNAVKIASSWHEDKSDDTKDPGFTFKNPQGGELKCVQIDISRLGDHIQYTMREDTSGIISQITFYKEWCRAVIRQQQRVSDERKRFKELKQYNPSRYHDILSNINKSGFLGMSTASTQPTQASQALQSTQPSARRGTSVSAQLSGLFGGEASAQDATTDDDAARASKVPKKTSTETATPAAAAVAAAPEPSAAAKKTQAAQSLGQSMKSMLTGARGKAAPKGKTMAAPSAPKDVATTDKTDIVPDDPMDDA